MENIFKIYLYQTNTNSQMAKVQLDLEDEIHLDVKIFQAKLEKHDKIRRSLKEVYGILVKKGLDCLKKETPTE